MRQTAAWATENSTVVFEGRVETQEIKSDGLPAPETSFSMNLVGAHRLVTFRAARVYRGPRQEQFVILTGLHEAACGFDFDTGKEYLVFASTMKSGDFFTSLCTETILLDHSGPALRYLRGEPAKPEDLLDSSAYNAKMLPQWTGTVCGRVTKPDGMPLGGAVVQLSEKSDEPFLPRVFSDPSLSKPGGAFCIQAMPGRYLLSAWDYDYDADSRLMGFYPGVTKRADAVPVQVTAKGHFNLHFKLHEESLYQVRIRVVMADGTAVPWKNPWEYLSVAIDSPYRDPLAYHLNHGVEEDGSFTFNFVPPGRYSVSSYVHPSPRELAGGRAPADLSRWQPARQEVDVANDTEVVLTLAPAK